MFDVSIDTPPLQETPTWLNCANGVGTTLPVTDQGPVVMFPTAETNGPVMVSDGTVPSMARIMLPTSPTRLCAVSCTVEPGRWPTTGVWAQRLFENERSPEPLASTSGLPMPFTLLSVSSALCHSSTLRPNARTTSAACHSSPTRPLASIVVLLWSRQFPEDSDA